MRSSAAWLASCVVTALSACDGPRTMVPDRAAAQWPTVESQLDFFDALATQDIVTNDDALHALLLFEYQDSPDSYDQRVARSVELGWIEASPGSAEASAATGMVASIVARTSDVDPGLALRLEQKHPWSPEGMAGLTAVKRLRALNMLPTRSPRQAMTGAELVALLRRVELLEAARAGSGQPLKE